MDPLTAPYFPIIYVRGYAMTANEIADTVATPYMGFNLGSTKVRQAWDGTVRRHVFESPLVRLMKDYGYRDTYTDGSEIDGELPARSVVIYRYYETADTDLGDGKVLSIVEAATGLRDLIRKLRDQVCGADAARKKAFRVYLIAHSMGGLVCRSFLQNDKISTGADRAMVDKVFTYATPHNGIEMAGFNVPAVLGLWDMNNFNRKTMAGYLGLKGTPERVDTLDGKFDPQQFFCFVGTNHRDYEAALGVSRKLAGEMSDGLVKIENATVSGAPRAFAYRSHSGVYGVVNSEEGYQNLVRFLFGLPFALLIFAVVAALTPDAAPRLSWRFVVAVVAGAAGQVAATAALLYERGRTVLRSVDDVVAGAPTPAGPEELMTLVDEILRGVFTGDFAVALERAASFCRVEAAGAADLADDYDDTEPNRASTFTTRALRLDTYAGDLTACAGLWRRDALT